MNGKSLEAPSLDQLLTSPGIAAALSPDAAQALLIRLVSLQPVLIQRALMGAQKIQDDCSLLTIKDVAQRLKVSEYRAYQLVRQGEIKKTSVGEKSVRVRASDFTAYLAKQRRG